MRADDKRPQILTVCCRTCTLKFTVYVTNFASFMYCTSHVLQICMYEPLTSQLWRQVVLQSVIVTWPLQKFSLFS